MSPKNYRHIQVLEETYNIIKTLAKDNDTTMIDVMAQMADQFNPKIPPTRGVIAAAVKEFMENDLYDYGFIGGDDPDLYNAAIKQLTDKITKSL